MTRLLLIRHALTASVGRHLSGRASGIHLNESGQKQAELLAQNLAHLPLAAIYSSPLERAIQTAEYLSAATGSPVTVNKNFLEIDFGEWTGLAFEQLERDPLFQRFNSFRSAVRIPHGETMHQAQGRIITGVGEIVALHPDQVVAVISHSDLIKAAIAYYGGIPLDLLTRLEIEPASVSILELNSTDVRISLINYTGKI